MFVSLAAAKFSDPLSIELLQLATLLMRCYTVKLSSSEYRQRLLMFSWGYLKAPVRPVDRETSPCKYFAFLNVCHFLEAFPAPDKIALQVFPHTLSFIHCSCAVACFPPFCIRLGARFTVAGRHPAWHHGTQEGVHQAAVWRQSSLMLALTRHPCSNCTGCK